MPFQRITGAILLVIVLVGGGATLGVRLTQGQEPDRPQATIAATGNGFTYQGQLSSAGATVSDSCDFTFALYDAESGGNQLGTTESENNVPVEDGRFTVLLNDSGHFGPDAFNGDPRWLDITVQCSGDTMPTSLGRQPLTAAPYALSAASAPWDGLTGIPAGIADGDDNTTYSAGTGLTLVGTQFRLSPLYQLPQSCFNGQIARWDGRAWGCDTIEGTPYANVIIVAKSGGDFTSIQAALDSITNASDANRYLISVAPGTYIEQVTMKPYVDIEGSGQDTTTILWTGGSQNPTTGSGSATIRAAAHSELRFLAVESFGTGKNYSLGIDIRNAGDTFLLTRVSSHAHGANTVNSSIHINNASPLIDSVRATASGGANSYGVQVRNNSWPLLTNLIAHAAGSSNCAFGVGNADSTPTIANSRITSDCTSLGHTIGTPGTIKVATSALSPPPPNGISKSCVFSYNATTLDPLGDTCLPIP